MSYRHTLEAVLESMHEIEDLVKGFPAEGKIPAVEIDLTLQKIRNLYELLLMMKKPGEETSVTPQITEAQPPTVAPPKKKAQVSEEKVVTSPKEVHTIADQFKGQTTLHETFHQANTRDDNTMSHAGVVTSLHTAIGINDRFTFIRELFRNDSAAYENAIGVLNDAASFNDAYNYMTRHFDWDMDSETVQQLLNIIRRKFIKGRHE